LAEWSEKQAKELKQQTEMSGQPEDDSKQQSERLMEETFMK